MYYPCTGICISSQNGSVGAVSGVKQGKERGGFRGGCKHFEVRSGSPVLVPVFPKGKSKSGAMA